MGADVKSWQRAFALHDIVNIQKYLVDDVWSAMVDFCIPLDVTTETLG